jgi:uncharacterized protein YndB with AHSA1/START domain
MLIRKPVSVVFDAFIDPAITSKFWFSKGSGKLEQGKRARWDWDMYRFSVQVDVKAVEPNERILIDWSSDGVAPTAVEWTFAARPNDTTFVQVTNSGFSGEGDELARQAIDSTQGFSFVLAGAKSWLEHGVQLNLIHDRHPDGL